MLGQLPFLAPRMKPLDTWTLLALSGIAAEFQTSARSWSKNYSVHAARGSAVKAGYATNLSAWRTKLAIRSRNKAA